MPPTDPFLELLDHQQRLTITKAFLQAIRQGTFSQQHVRRQSDRNHPTELRGRTVQAAASQLAATFKRNGRPSPLHLQDDPNQLDPNIRRLYRAWEKLDPPTQREEPINPEHLLFIHNRAISTNDEYLEAQSHLLIAGFFFACRSCEYSDVTRRGRTKLLCVRNITFHDADCRIIPHSTPSVLHTATKVTVCFEDQKNAQRFDRRTQQKTHHPILCPVKAFAKTIERILSYPKQSEFPLVSTRNAVQVGVCRFAVMCRWWIVARSC